MSYRKQISYLELQENGQRIRMPEVCYMIGDNPAADILGAARAGIPSVLVHRKFGSGRISDAAYEFERLESILLIL